MSPIFGSDSGGHPREPSDEGQEPKVVINDKRRIDPETGQLREPAANTTFPVDEGGTAGPTGQPQVDDALTLAQMEIAERTSDLQRVTAEYANYRKRVERDREAVALNAKASVVSELLTVIDDVDRAESHGDLVGAFKAVTDRFLDILGKQGLVGFAEVGDSFDPSEHDAVQFGTSAEVDHPTVTSVLRRGYRFSDKLIRAAMVVVTGPESESSSEPTTDADSSGAEVNEDEVIDAEVIDEPN